MTTPKRASERISCPVHSTPGGAVLPLFLLPHALIGTLTCDGSTACIGAHELVAGLGGGWRVVPVPGRDGRTYAHVSEVASPDEQGDADV